MADGSKMEMRDHILPHNIEAEQALLGALLVNNDVYDRIAGLVGEDHFYDPVHGRIFSTIAQRIQKNALASPVTIKAFLADDARRKPRPTTPPAGRGRCRRRCR